MAANTRSVAVTTTQVSAVSFGFYTPEEVRAFSVKQVVSPLSRDNLGNPVPGGLYDPALGPLEDFGNCATCGMRKLHCLGHFGHAELAVPVYNPLVFSTLYRLLRTICLHCYSFKLAEAEVERYMRRMQLLAKGHLLEAMQVTAGTSRANEAAGKISGADEGNTEPEDPFLAALKADEQKVFDSKPRPPVPLTSHTVEALQATIAGFFGRTPARKCANCGAHCPAISRHGSTRLFQAVLSLKQLEANRSNGTVVENPLVSMGQAPAELEAVEREMAEQLQVSQARRNRQHEATEDSPTAEMETQDAAEPEKEEAAGVAKVEDSKSKPRRAKDKDKDVLTMQVDDLEGAPSSAAAAELRPRYMTVSEVMEIMKRAWERNAPMLRTLYGRGASAVLRPGKLPMGKAAAMTKRNAFESLYLMFFVQTLPIAPSRVRPIQYVNGIAYENPANIALAKIINLNLDIAGVSARAQQAQAEGSEDLNADQQRAFDLGTSLRLWLELQGAINGLFDSTTADRRASAPPGIRQQLEKKEGLFRKNMMGKRVNFAARSVISPDPYLGTGEIGVPPYFAMRLTYPERVTAFNVEDLRERVIRGANEHPGALAIENEVGQVVRLDRLLKHRREAAARLLLTPSGPRGQTASSGAAASAGHIPGRRGVAGKAGSTAPAGVGKIVYRHMQDGDVMLTNRQPTLHRPGMMAHRARVLRGERTIRMHYANCSTFNADFDGDEINLHLPQDALARAEGYGIVHADHQFNVPTDGKPLRGLIQDHVIGGTLLTLRDTFLTRKEYLQLLYAGCAPTRPGLRDAVDLQPCFPAVLKPRVLWTGKQVMTALVAHFTRGLPPMTLSAKGKVGHEYMGLNSEELDVRFHKGELLTGCMDKGQYGRHGLLHGIQELYGDRTAAMITGAFGRLFTAYLQMRGFTCGMDDLLVQQPSEADRLQILARTENTALQASSKAVGDKQFESADADDMVRQQVVREAMADKFYTNPAFPVALDMSCTSALQPLSSEVVQSCLPKGQVKPFPGNCMALMTATGAKGSIVNFSQICCLLGQQELEGRRVPRMASGKTLPCFAPFDGGARSNGYVGDRFLSGLRPQEYYFHCMAGREGLVDTTVKTSRSGYLQRCMVKNLEALRVHYDSTVRNDCDGSIVQFQYGDDGLDIPQSSFVKEFGFLARNAARFAQTLDLPQAEAASQTARLAGMEAEAARLKRQRQKRLAKAAAKGKESSRSAQDLPVSGQFPATCLGVTSEKFADTLATFAQTDPHGLFSTGAEETKAVKRKRGVAQGQESAAARFQRLMDLKFMQCQAQPGEGVGVLAAQSIGEPSTQMTLNTFHMAGRGEANVTLGIPRLREVLMTASKSIALPVMTLPLHAHCTRKDADDLAIRLSRMTLAQATERIEIEERPIARNESMPFGLARHYNVRFRVFPAHRYPPNIGITLPDVEACFARQFVPRLQAAVKAEVRRSNTEAGAGTVSASAVTGDGSAAPPAGAAGVSAEKKARKSEKQDEDENEEDNDEYKEGKLRFAGGRREAATYDDGDVEDAAIAKDARTEAARAAGDYDSSDENPDAEPGQAQNTLSNTARQPATPSVQATASPAASDEDEEADMDEEMADAAGGNRVKAEGENVLEARIALPLTAPKVLMLKLVQDLAAAVAVRATPGIKKCLVQEGKPMKLQTEGVNIHGAWLHADLADPSTVDTNDIAAVFNALGVEAARATLVRECSAVFGVYGIAVDPRHLSLIADFMTHQGSYRACNRIGIESSTSSFLKISFETAAHFLTQATLAGTVDPLTSPAARIVMGRQVQLGTGSFSLIHDLGSGS